jgi:hypothetical protein
MYEGNQTSWPSEAISSNGNISLLKEGDGHAYNIKIPWIFSTDPMLSTVIR